MPGVRQADRRAIPCRGESAFHFRARGSHARYTPGVMGRCALVLTLALGAQAWAGEPRAALLLSQDASGALMPRVGGIERTPLPWKKEGPRSIAHFTSRDGGVRVTVVR